MAEKSIYFVAGPHLKTINRTSLTTKATPSILRPAVSACSHALHLARTHRVVAVAAADDGKVLLRGAAHVKLAPLRAAHTAHVPREEGGGGQAASCRARCATWRY